MRLPIANTDEFVADNSPSTSAEADAAFPANLVVLGCVW
jgi:hypothetical protein